MAMTPGRLWWLFRRDLKRGFRASWNDYKTLPRIGDWSWPYWAEEPAQVPVHILTGANDWRLAAWMLASWFHFTEQAWPVIVHEDGTLPAEGRATLLRLFPDTRIIERAHADAVMAKALTPFPFCADYRKAHPLALKIFDAPHFTPGERFLMLDSDLLFFDRPEEILTWCRDGKDECWFNEDVQEGALLSAAEAREDLGIKLWPRVNSGLCLLAKKALDLDLCDRALAETSILSGHVWRTEQTLFALCASKYAKGGLLPRRYEVSLGKFAAPDAICRHYVGAVRDRFYAEGLDRLRGVLFAEEAA
jgi:hypothetical protein